MEGSALETLGRFPRLRVLRLELSEGRPFTVPRLPLLPNLEALNIRGLPGSPWGFSHLGPSVPALSWLSLESAGDLVLDGECPGCGWCLDLTGRRAVGGASLPSRLNMAGLHLSGASGTQVEDLLANVDTAQSLSLRETPVEERTAIRLAARLGLERLDLRNTGLDDDAIGRISEACPKTKIFPSSKRGARNEG